MRVTANDVMRLSGRANPEIAEGIEKHSRLLNEYAINTPLRMAHFMAQLAHESDGFKATREYHDGSNYEGRRDLGNTEAGDGKRYRGRGLIQLTGRYNYRKAGDALGLNLVGHPELAEKFPAALEVSCWFWAANGLNELADRDDVRAVTRRINGGLNGFEDRNRYLGIAKRIWYGETKEAYLGRPTRRAGDRGANVELIQGLVGAAPQDGIFGPKTEDAVKALQRRHGLTDDGIVGPETWRVLMDQPGTETKPQDPWWRPILDTILSIFRR